MNSTFFSILITLLFTLPVSILSAQHMQKELDSLWESYHRQIDQLKQIDLLNEISYAYRRISPDSVMKYAERAILLSHDLDYFAGLASAYKNKGIALYKLGETPDTIISYYQKASRYAQQTSDYYTQAACLNNIALIHIYNLSYNEAIKSLLNAVEIFEQHIEEDNRLKALILGNLGTAYHAQREPKKSIEYLEKALAIGEVLKDKSITAMYIDELAMTKMKTGRIREAYEDIVRSLPIADELGDMESKSSFLVTLAEIEARLLNFDSSQVHALQALEIAREHNFIRKTIQSLTVLSQGLAETGQIQEAINRAREALDTSRAAKMFWYEAKTLLLLSDLYRQKQDFRLAFDYLQRYNEVHERNLDRENKETTARMEANFDAKERQNQINLLQQEQLAQRNHIRLLWFTSAFFLLLLFVGSYVYFLKWRTSRAAAVRKKQAVAGLY